MILLSLSIFNSVLVLTFSWAVFEKQADPLWFFLHFLMSFLFFAMIISLGKQGGNPWWGKDTGT